MAMTIDAKDKEKADEMQRLNVSHEAQLIDLESQKQKAINAKNAEIDELNSSYKEKLNLAKRENDRLSGKVTKLNVIVLLFRRSDRVM